MKETITDTTALPLLGSDWSDPIEDGIRSRVRGFIEAIIEEELETALGRGRYERSAEQPVGYRNSLPRTPIRGPPRARGDRYVWLRDDPRASRPVDHQ